MKATLKIGKIPRKHLFSSLYTFEISKVKKRKRFCLWLKQSISSFLSLKFWQQGKSFLLGSAILAVEDLNNMEGPLWASSVEIPGDDSFLKKLDQS